MAHFRCGSCGFEKDVPSEYAGKRVRCPKCKVEGRVEAGGGSGTITPADPAGEKIRFNCPGCGQKMGVPSEYAGKKVRCPKCKTATQVPAAARDVAAVAPQTSPEELSLRHEPPAQEVIGTSGGPGMEDLLELERRMMASQKRAETMAVASLGGKDRAFVTDGTSVNRKAGIMVLAGVVIGVLVLAAWAGSILAFGKSTKQPDMGGASAFGFEFLRQIADPNSTRLPGMMSQEMQAATGAPDLQRLRTLMETVPGFELRETRVCYSTIVKEFGYAIVFEPNDGQRDCQVTLILQSLGQGFRVEGLTARDGQANQGRGIRIITERGRTILLKASLNWGMGWRDRATPIFWWVVTGLNILIMLMVECSWFVLFRKAGYWGWAAFVPVVNLWILAMVADKPPRVVTMVFLVSLYGLYLMPLVGFIVVAGLMLWLSIGVAQEFDRGIFWGLALWLFPWIFYPILAFVSE